MKTAIFFLLACVGLNAADFTASTFFQTPVNVDTEEVKPAGGINLRAIVWRGFGADVDLIQSAFRDSFLDRSAAHIVYELPLSESLHAVGFAGPAYDFEDDESGVEIGAGLEYSFVEGPVFGFNLRWQKDDSEDHLIVPTISAGWRW